MKKKRYVGALLLIACLAIFWACSRNSNNKISEGVIEFDIDYPYYQGSYKKLLPKKMIMSFNEDMFKSVVAKGNLFKIMFLAQVDSFRLQSSYSFLEKESFTANPAKDELGKIIGNFPEPIYISTNETDTIAGKLCKKTIAVFKDLNLREVVLWSTDELDMKTPNWCTPFSEIDGVLLAYEIERFGLIMRFRANKIIPQTIPIEEFVVAESFEIIPIEAFEQKLKHILN